jgi:hypothetical protein
VGGGPLRTKGGGEERGRDGVGDGGDGAWGERCCVGVSSQNG